MSTEVYINEDGDLFHGDCLSTSEKGALTLVRYPSEGDDCTECGEPILPEDEDTVVEDEDDEDEEE